MEQAKKLYPNTFNPLLIHPSKPLPQEVAIIGAGTIGPDIGYYIKSALPNITLYLVDISEEALKNSEKRLSGYIQKAVDRNKMSNEKAKAVNENIIYTTEYNKISNCELVIEAATESLSLKQKIFSEVESIVNKDTIITSNTSSIPAQQIFSTIKRPERTSITHFFAPAWRSLPVEVITWEKASQEVIDYLFWFFGYTGKVPIITHDVVCFMLDRIFDNWCNEAAYLLDQATASQIDKVTEEFVFAGPFYVLNLANGNPIIIETNTNQMEKEGSHYKPALILDSVDRWKTHSPGSKVQVPDEIKKNIRDRMLGILFSQALDIVDRGVGTPEDLNFGCQVAFGFKKGPMDIMPDLGEDEVNRIVNKFQDERPGFPRGKQSLPSYQNFNRYILVDDQKGVKIITLRRPQAMNALNDDITNEILAVFKKYHEDPSVEGFVITGYGINAFSAGADIGRFPQVLGDKEAAVRYAKECAEVQQFMDKMNKPLVAAINGMALGGGLELAIRCDSLISIKNARFQFPEITLGILPGIGGCIVPYRKWPEGANVFHEMLCLGKSITAQEAKDIGMVDELANNHSELLQKAVDKVRMISEKQAGVAEGKIEIPQIQIPSQPMAGKQTLSKEAISIIVKTIHQGVNSESFEEALETGYQGFGEIACTEAAKEGIAAFLEKRKPEFKK